MLDHQYNRSDSIRRKWLRLTIATLVVVGAIFVLWIAIWGEDSKIPTGQIVPDFTLPTIDGSFTLSDHRGDVVVLFYSFPG